MEHKWYIVHAYSNFENKVADAIKQSASEKGMSELFDEVFVPTEEVTEVRRGRKILSERRYLPGYVLVKMVLNDQTYHLIKDTPKVTGFLGSGNKPMPVSQREVDRIRGVVSDSIERPRSTITFEIGENVRVTDGPFATFSGVVEDVDEDQQRVKVAVSIFGRATPVELEFAQVEKNR
ncbi:MAG TPA: transcription termination/antitermination protein NusG, partial [Parvularcula sp.]|nr:transcription termination/antitermination protein NusG [Parvularcula sp.]HBS31558.1 transcription termination/antitermination protein NusG [Parvularcula sp.]HBS35495.1 transcription termination/antitermination protein NusG [Parvularcula sp.]